MKFLFPFIRCGVLISLLVILAPLSYGQTDTSASGFRAAIYPGGLDSLYQHLEENFRLSRLDNPFRMNEELIANVRLTINRKGEVIHVTSGDSRIEYELERALRALSPFEAATENGKPVTSYLDLRFMFLIKGNRMEVIDHIHYFNSMHTQETGWLKAALAGAAIMLFLLLWGI
jgi:hypothetical protein